MPDATRNAIQVLLDQPGGEGMIVSCYADTSVSDGFNRTWAQRLKKEARDIAARLTDRPDAAARFARDLDVVFKTLEQPPVQSARGIAIFSAADRGLLQVFPLGVPVADRLVLDESPYLVPLLEAMHRQRRYLLVLTDSRHGRVYEAAWGHLALLEQIEEPVPRRQRQAGELWGKQQATIARHREDHILHYLKRLSGAIERAWPEAPFRGVILLGDHDAVAELRRLMPPALADRVVHTGPYNFSTNTPDPADEVAQVLDEIMRSHDASLVADFERHMQEHHLIAAGAPAVVDALWNGQVGYPGYLLLEPDHGATASRCTQCGAVTPATVASCPVCGGACENVSLWQEVLLFAQKHGVSVHVVSSHPALAEHGGVAAVLSGSGRPVTAKRPA